MSSAKGVILIDIGHTSVKWCRQSNLEQIYRAKNYHESLALLQATKDSVSDIYLACVDESLNIKKMAEDTYQYFPHVSFHIMSVVQTAALTVQYDDLSKLGVDRWLLAIASVALNQTKACCIDMGSAITIEYIQNGLYQGGYILPGFEMNAQQMGKLTNRTLNWSEMKTTSQEPGKNSTQCIVQGYNAILLGFIERVLEKGENTVFVTGGGALHIDWGEYPMIRYLPHMVFIGMNQLIEQGEGFESLTS